MGFTDLLTDAGVHVLNSWLTTRSYIAGYGPSQADVATFKGLKESPQVAKYPHAYRWYKHINSFQPEFSSLPGDPSKSYTAYGPEAVAVAPQEAPKAEEEDEDDLFASEEEEEDPEVVRKREENLAAYRKKNEEKAKAGKGKPVAKSVVTLEIKPKNDKTDLALLTKMVKEVSQDGLTWGAHTYIPVAFGIKKLQMTVVVEDEKVSLDDLTEWISGEWVEDDDDDEEEDGDKEEEEEEDEALEGEEEPEEEKKPKEFPYGVWPSAFGPFVQSCDVLAMQKL